MFSGRAACACSLISKQNCPTIILHDGRHEISAGKVKLIDQKKDRLGVVSLIGLI